MKRIYLFVLAALLMTAALVGCKKVENGQPASSTEKTAAPAKELSAKEAEELGKKDPIFADAYNNFKPIPQDVKAGFKELKNNEGTEKKYELGKRLYFEPRLSKSQLISCNTCHNLAVGGDDYQETSIGHGWQKGPRNAPTVFNSVYNTVQFWDGRAADLKEQAKGPIQAGVEMAATPEYVIEVLKSMPEYVEEFKAAFPGEADPVNFDNVAKAIEVFEATLLTPDSKFDQYLRGDLNALNDTEKNGLKLYMDNGCTGCHTGINLTSADYYQFGVIEKPDAKYIAGDKGRFAVTQAKDDEFAFKAPTLRNIEYTAPYFHSGKVWDLREAVAIMSSSQLGIDLNDKEIDDIVAFLKTTTGKMPVVEYPVLPPSTNKTPKPTYTIDEPKK